MSDWFNDRLAETNPAIPYLRFVLGPDTDDPFLLTVDANDRSLTGPPYVQSFSMARKVRNFAATEWSLTLFDPSFSVLDRLVYELVEGQSDQSNTFGTVSYSFGYGRADGQVDGLISPTISGMVLTVMPQYVRDGMRLTITGIDFNLFGATRRISVAVLLAAIQGQITGTVTDLIAAATPVLSSEQAPVMVAYEPPELESQLTLDAMSMWAQEGNNYAGAIQRMAASLGGEATLADMSLSTFLNIVQDYCNFLLGGDNAADEIKIRIDGTEASDSLTLTIVQGLSASASTRPAFFLNTTKTDLLTDNVSNVISFTPNFDPLAIHAAGAAYNDYQAIDRFTRQWQSGEVLFQDSRGPQLGDGMLVMPGFAASGSESGIALKKNASQFAGGGHLSAGMLDEHLLRRSRQAVLNTYSRWNITATLVVAFPPPAIEPWSLVDVFVYTPGGSTIAASGTFEVTDIKYQIVPGNLTGTFRLIKSGTVDTPVAPDIEPEAPNVFHDAEAPSPFVQGPSS